MAFLDALAGAALVLRVGIGVEEADRDRVDPDPREPGHRLVERRLVERLQHFAVRPHPLPRLEPPVARDQRRRLRDGEVVELVLALASNLEGVPKPPGGDEPGARALALDEGVGEEGGRVHHALHRPGIEALLREEPGDPLLRPPGRVVVGGKDLARDGPFRTPHHDVGERPADVDPDRPHARQPNPDRGSGPLAPPLPRGTGLAARRERARSGAGRSRTGTCSRRAPCASQSRATAAGSSA